MGQSSADVQALRNRLVDGLWNAGHVRNVRVAAALRVVPRHVFVPGVAPERAYRDEALPIKSGEDGRPISSSSQPAIMAQMLHQLDVRPGQRVLEIGAGSGYNAALLAHLVGETGSVVSVDIDEDLVVRARERLIACGMSRVMVVCGDGGLGWPEQAPYDRIIATVGAWDLPPAWTQQLGPYGRLVVPLDLRGVQRSIAFEPADDHLQSVSVIDCGFMRIRGAFAGPEAVHPLGPEPGLFLELTEQRPVDADAVYAALTQPGPDVASGVRATRSDVWGGLSLWLALHEPAMARLSAIGASTDQGLVPVLIAYPGYAGTIVLLGAHAVAALVFRGGGEPFELAARPLGRGGQSLARQLVTHIHNWDTHHRPPTRSLRVCAYPQNRSGGATSAADTVIDKHHHQLALSWTPQ